MSNIFVEIGTLSLFFQWFNAENLNSHFYTGNTYYVLTIKSAAIRNFTNLMRKLGDKNTHNHELVMTAMLSVVNKNQ